MKCVICYAESGDYHFCPTCYENKHTTKLDALGEVEFDMASQRIAAKSVEELMYKVKDFYLATRGREKNVHRIAGEDFIVIEGNRFGAKVDSNGNYFLDLH